MTRCEEFFTKLEQLKAEGDEAKLREFCNKSYDMMQKLENHITFMKKVITDDGSTMVESPAVVPERATREVRSESREVQEKIIPKIQEALQKGEKVTTPKVKQWVNEVRNPEFWKSEIPKNTENVEKICPSCQPISLKDNFCPICPKECDGKLESCPVSVFVEWQKRGVCS